MDPIAATDNKRLLALCGSLKLSSKTTNELLRYHECYDSAAPEETPFVHKYEARELLLHLRQRLIDAAEPSPNMLLGVIALRLATNFRETEETSAAFPWFKESLMLMDQPFWKSTMERALRSNPERSTEEPELPPVDWHPEGLPSGEPIELERSCAYYEFAALLCQWEDHKAAAIALGRAQEILGELTPQHSDAFRKIYAEVTFLDAQAHMALGNREKATKQCIETLRLKRTLPGVFITKEWVQESISLNVLLVGQDEFGAAWHCLQAAERAIAECDPLELDTVKADLDLAVGAFCRALLANEPSSIAKGKRAFNLDGKREEDKPLDMSLETFDAAREVFKVGFKHYDLAKKLYVLDGYVTQNVNILRGQCALYVSLASYEEDPKRRLAMLRRAVAITRPLLKELNPKIYHSEHVEISLELARVSRRIAEILEERWQSGGLKNVAKLNKAAEESMGFFQHFIDCFDETQESFVQDMKQDLNLVEAYVSAHFNLAKLCSNMKNTTDAEKLEYYKKSMRLHEKAIKLRRQLVAPGSELLQEEAKYSKEIIELLAETISRLHFTATRK